MAFLKRKRALAFDTDDTDAIIWSLPLTAPAHCQLASGESDYAQVKHDRADDNDKTIRLPESAPFHFVLAVVLVLIAHLVPLRVQRRQSAHAGVIERREFLGLSV